MMTPKRFVLLNTAFTLTAWAIGVLMAMLLAYICARIRGDLLPDGSIGNGGPMSVWTSINFRTYLLSFLCVGSVLGVAVGQSQFWMWVKHHQ